MGTKAIREALDWVENYLGNEPEAQEVRRAARAELAAIEKAAHEVMELRSQPISSVARWQDVYDLMESIAKEAK